MAAPTSGLCGDGRIPERFRIELASPNHKLLPLFPGEMVLSSKVLAWLRPSHATLVQSHIYFCVEERLHVELHRRQLTAYAANSHKRPDREHKRHARGLPVH